MEDGILDWLLGRESPEAKKRREKREKDEAKTREAIKKAREGYKIVREVLEKKPKASPK